MGNVPLRIRYFFVLLIALSHTLIRKFTILSFVPLFLLSDSLSVHPEVLVNYKNEEEGLFESENHNLPLLHRHAEEGHKSHYP